MIRQGHTRKQNLGVLLLLLLVPASIAVTWELRARELFYTPVAPLNTTPLDRENARSKRQRKMQAAPAAHSGIRCTLELLGSTGQWSWVPLTRTFVSGERVRLHIDSNVDARLSILQKQDGDPPVLLFPRRGLEDLDRIKAGQDTAIRFIFDEKPGLIRLMILLRPDVADSGVPSVENTPQTLMSRAEHVLRGRGLRIDDDDTAPRPARFVVRPSFDRDPDRFVAAEIELRHSARSAMHDVDVSAAH